MRLAGSKSRSAPDSTNINNHINLMYSFIFCDTILKYKQFENSRTSTSILLIYLLITVISEILNIRSFKYQKFNYSSFNITSVYRKINIIKCKFLINKIWCIIVCCHIVVYIYFYYNWLLLLLLWKVFKIRKCLNSKLLLVIIIIIIIINLLFVIFWKFY